MQRYLLKFSYSGVLFRGLQRQPGEVFTKDLIQRASIETILEKGIEKLKPANRPKIQFSSRTDQGVHSFCNVAHIDLENFDNGTCYSPGTIQKILNRYLHKENISLLITHVEAVPDNFHARFSSFSRQYIYRLGVTDSHIHPIAEWRKCHFIKNPFNVEQALEACKLFDGIKNFATFCHGLTRLRPDYPTIRRLDYLTIKPGTPLFNPAYDPLYEGIKFYEVHTRSNAFMYKQVRRMVSVLIAVAQNRMTLEEVQQLFDQPGVWNSKASTVPPYGLYLVDVKYKVSENVELQ